MCEVSVENGQVHGHQVFGFNLNHVYCGFTPFCMAEVRMLLHGKLVIAGIPFDGVPGDNAKEKRNTLLRSTIDGMRQIIIEAPGSFLMQLADVGAIMIPSGFMVVMAASEECVGLRWGVAGDEGDSIRVGHTLSQFLMASPEMRNPSHGYGQLHEWLTTD